VQEFFNIFELVDLHHPFLAQKSTQLSQLTAAYSDEDGEL